MRVSINRIARGDIADAAAFIAEDNAAVAYRFLESVEETVNIIRRSPLIGRPKKIAGEEGLRMWFVKNFPNYLIFYTAAKTEICVIRIIHSARDYTKVLLR